MAEGTALPLPQLVLTELDEATAQLVRLAATIAAGTEAETRAAFAAAVDQSVPARWIEELVLQSYLFSGFPRALNAAREWRRLNPAADGTPAEDEDEGDVAEWRAQGERTCAAVYGGMYERLRDNIHALHPALDQWMIVEGYGKVLSRPGLDLPRRELCIVAACAATGQDRQLHSHLHGALNVGVGVLVLGGVIDALEPVLGPERAHAVRMLLARVAGK